MQSQCRKCIKQYKTIQSAIKTNVITMQTMLKTIENNTINNTNNACQQWYEIPALPAQIAPIRLKGVHAQAVKQSSVYLKAHQE
jgi:hypothetical protein